MEIDVIFGVLHTLLFVLENVSLIVVVSMILISFIVGYLLCAAQFAIYQMYG